MGDIKKGDGSASPPSTFSPLQRDLYWLEELAVAWHGGAGQGQNLQDYLRLTDTEYNHWLDQSDDGSES